MAEIAILNVRTRLEWEAIIDSDWRKSFESVMQIGHNLNAAEAQLDDAEFVDMLKTGLPFSRDTARTLMKIARNPSITSAGPARRLPSSWSILATLCSLSAEDFKDAQESGLINAKTSKRKARALVKTYHTKNGGYVWQGNAPAMLPSPKEAREIARATKRMVAASDGNLYSGATEEEGAEHVRLRTQAYGVIDAINTIVDNGVSPKQWCEEVKKHWLNRFEFGRIELAAEWLLELEREFIRQNLMFEVEADGE